MFFRRFYMKLQYDLCHPMFLTLFKFIPILISCIYLNFNTVLFLTDESLIKYRKVRKMNRYIIQLILN